ncbi:c-type cytochrome [Gymnodinialimonas hymeniacidonis]|uniref:c-type cytochrome n=1 Tax=Gymnodinialimonas hymeniacidonis TaxID=3126508 RepID=UPI0034C67947
MLKRCMILTALGLIAGAPADAQDTERGARLYTDHCAVCHGTALLGDGPMAEVLVVPPANLRMIEGQNGGYFPRVGVAGHIDGRDPLLSHGGEMPVFGRMFSEMSEVMTSPGGDTVLTSPEVIDLVEYLATQQD